MFELLGAAGLSWARIAVFQVDERIAPPGDEDRNLGHLRASLPEEALGSIVAMPVDAADLEGAARSYAEALPGRLDLVHLGLGPDGHTASLVPGDPVLEVTDRPVALAGPYQGRRRMTLTFPALASARELLWLVTGEDKREALAKLLARDRSIPAARVEAASATIVCERALLAQ